MAAKQLVVAVFLLGACWNQRVGADDPPALPRDMADQCIRNGGMEANNNVERAIKQLSTCYSNLGDSQKLFQDIQEAQRLSRSVNGVFKKYCSRKSEFVGCISELTESFKECFAAGERARGNLDVARNVADQLLEFICQEDGAVSTSFITAGGLKCLKRPYTDDGHPGILLGCLLSIQAIVPHRSNNTINNVLDIDFDDGTCAILYKFQQCVVQELVTCSQEVGDTAQALIRTLRVSTPCRYKPNSASGLTVTVLSSVMAASCLLLM